MILLGDQQQLTPMILGPVRGPLTVFNQLIDAKYPYTMLTECYRMHKEILSVPNKLFYDNRMKSSYIAPKRGNLSKLRRAVCFVDINSKESKVGTSFIN
jgi:superfamily I DNA and/or RNA helicase